MRYNWTHRRLPLWTARCRNACRLRPPPSRRPAVVVVVAVVVAAVDAGTPAVRTAMGLVAPVAAGGAGPVGAARVLPTGPTPLPRNASPAGLGPHYPHCPVRRRADQPAGKGTLPLDRSAGGDQGGLGRVLLEGGIGHAAPRAPSSDQYAAVP